MKDEPAFPTADKIREHLSLGKAETVTARGGLTKREYFASAAMQGVLADSHIMNLIRNDAEPGMEDTADFVAGLAVEYADALIAKLEWNNDR